MKCSFCGKELEQGAEFCPECGMILSLGGVSDQPEEKAQVSEETEIPEYTPNVFKAMDFEEEPEVPAMELEVTDTEETAVVVEAIPEYVPEEEIVEVSEPETVEEAVEAVEEEIYDAPEYDPNAQVSAEFMQEAEAVEEAEAYEEQVEPGEKTEEVEVVSAEDEFAPPEYEAAVEAQSEEEPVYELPTEEADEEYEEAYPVYNADEDEVVPEEKPTEDESLFAALFESEDEGEKLEDITPVAQAPVKESGKNSFTSIVILVIVLVGVVFGGGYVFKNVLPKVVDTSNTTTSATAEKVDATTAEAESTTDEATTETTEATTTEATTEVTTEADITEADTTTEITTETTTQAAVADEAEKPSSYNVDEVPFFPINDDIVIKAAPASSASDIILHPYGYPVYAYAKEGGFYYVHSPVLDVMGWVDEDVVLEYVEETTAAAIEETEEDAPAADSEVSYLAVISAPEGLNFRQGPGTDYATKYVVPGGYYVRVTLESAENPGWVYVTIEDSRYPYGSPSGWVSADFLA